MERGERECRDSFSQDGNTLALPQGGTTFGTRMVKAGGLSAHGMGGGGKVASNLMPS